MTYGRGRSESSSSRASVHPASPFERQPPRRRDVPARVVEDLGRLDADARAAGSVEKSTPPSAASGARARSRRATNAMCACPGARGPSSSARGRTRRGRRSLATPRCRAGRAAKVALPRPGCTCKAERDGRVAAIELGGAATRRRTPFAGFLTRDAVACGAPSASSGSRARALPAAPVGWRAEPGAASRRVPPQGRKRDEPRHAEAPGSCRALFRSPQSNVARQELAFLRTCVPARRRRHRRNAGVPVFRDRRPPVA